MLKFTLDTSVFVEDDAADSRKRSSIRCRDICERLHRQGIVELAMSRRFEADKENDRDEVRRERHFTHLESYNRIATLFRLDVDYLDEEYLWGSSEECAIFDEMEQLFIKNKTSTRHRNHSMFDADHIWAHRADKRDYFITSDAQAEKTLRRELFQRFGVKVIHPDEFMSAFEASDSTSGHWAETFRAKLAHFHDKSIQ